MGNRRGETAPHAECNEAPSRGGCAEPRVITRKIYNIFLKHIMIALKLKK